MSETEIWLTLQEAADYLGITTQYAYQMRYNKKGPKGEKRAALRLGPGPRSRIYYKKSDLDIWNLERKAKKDKASKAPKKSKPRVSKKAAQVAEAA